MSDSMVKKQGQALKTLRRGVLRYSEQVRDVGTSARSQASDVHRKAEDAVERRRSNLRKCERELSAAQTALAACRENCGGLQRALATAQENCRVAKQQLVRAQKAVQLTAEAQSELAAAHVQAQAAVSEHSSIASSALARLDGMLAAMGQSNFLQGLKGAGQVLVVTAEVVSAMGDGGRLVANAAQALGADTRFADQSVTEMRERNESQQLYHLGEKQVEGEARSRSRQSLGEDPGKSS